MPFSFLNYHIARKWQIVPQKMFTTGKKFHGHCRTIIAIKEGKNVDISLWLNAISPTTSIELT
jgi:hypothetical protein